MQTRRRQVPQASPHRPHPPTHEHAVGHAPRSHRLSGAARAGTDWLRPFDKSIEIPVPSRVQSSDWKGHCRIMSMAGRTVAAAAGRAGTRAGGPVRHARARTARDRNRLRCAALRPIIYLLLDKHSVRMPTKRDRQASGHGPSAATRLNGYHSGDSLHARPPPGNHRLPRSSVEVSR